MKLIALFVLAITTAAFASELPTGSYQGRTNRNMSCYYKFDGQTLVFGHFPDDRMSDVCVIRNVHVVSQGNTASVADAGCEASFTVSGNSIKAIMTFNEAPFKTIRCLDLKK